MRKKTLLSVIVNEEIKELLLSFKYTNQSEVFDFVISDIFFALIYASAI